MVDEIPTTPEALMPEHYTMIARWAVGLQPFAICAYEDVVSEVRVQLLTSLSRFDPKKGKLKTFLFSRAKYAVIDYWRKEYKVYYLRNPKVVDWAIESEEQPARLDPDWVADPNCISQEDLIDIKARLNARLHPPKEPKRRRGCALAKHLEGKLTLASRRGNIPDPRHFGFPWSGA